MTAIEPSAARESEARELTHQIRDAAETIHRLVLRVHDERAWAALGYDSWGDYADAELHVN